jgi:hypothetical protein
MKKEVCETNLLIFMAVLLITYIIGAIYAGTSTGLPWVGSIKMISAFCAIIFTGVDARGWARWVAVTVILSGLLL